MTSKELFWSELESYLVKQLKEWFLIEIDVNDYYPNKQKILDELRLVLGELERDCVYQSDFSKVYSLARKLDFMENLK